MPRYISQFAAVTLLPAGLLVLGAFWGGYWPVVGFLYLTAFSHLADRLIGDMAESDIDRHLKTALPVCLGVVHFALLAVAVWALAIKPGGGWEKLFILLGFGQFFATVSNATGHELIHRRRRLEHSLGKWMFISHLFGHHTSAHPLVHHPFVATDQDPNSARLNEGFPRFWRRAWLGSFRAGLAAENARRAGAGKAKFTLGHPYVVYVSGAVALLALAGAYAGFWGVLAYGALAFIAQSGLLLTDYVQHYGLRRDMMANGKPEPVDPKHSWNAPHWFTRHLTLNATRHSDHHIKPAKPYTDLLGLPASEAPILPYPAGVMALIALYPRLWRRVMNPRVAQARRL